MTANVTAQDRYLELTQEFPVRPIRSEEELLAAIARIDSLLPLRRDAPELSPDEEDYLEALGMMVHRYEEVHHPLPEMSGVEILKFLMSENELSIRGLAEEIEVPFSTLGAILAGRRKISPRVREALTNRFAMHPSAFI